MTITLFLQQDIALLLSMILFILLFIYGASKRIPVRGKMIPVMRVRLKLSQSMLFVLLFIADIFKLFSSVINDHHDSSFELTIDIVPLISNGQLIVVSLVPFFARHI